MGLLAASGNTSPISGESEFVGQRYVAGDIKSGAAVTVARTQASHGWSTVNRKELRAGSRCYAVSNCSTFCGSMVSF